METIDDKMYVHTRKLIARQNTTKPHVRNCRHEDVLDPTATAKVLSFG